ncbi:MAG: PQQ-like beta-propeller repeat protein, partial [Planctomycetales bacterium]
MRRAKLVGLLLPATALLIGGARAAEPSANQPSAKDITQTVGMERGLALVVADDLELAADLADEGRMLVHLLMPNASLVERTRSLARARGLGGRVMVDPLPAGGRLPHPARFVNLLVADLDDLENKGAWAKEFPRVMAVRGAVYVKRDGQWRATATPSNDRLDGWFAHWYDAAGNCVSQDREAGFPRAVQWRHGPAMEDGTADGKIPRVADGRVVLMDNASGDLVCRDAGNGLLLWRLQVGSRQNAEVSLAAGKAHLWRDAESLGNRRSDREAGPLVAIDLKTGKIAKVYDQGLRAGTAPSVEVPWGDRTRKVEPVAWFVVNDRVIVQAYGSELVVLDRESGKRRWSKSIQGASWFSPVVSGDLVLAAEAVYPG